MMPETSGGRFCDPSKAPTQTETGTRGGEGIRSKDELCAS